jgi:hypothetical protein
LPLGEEVSFEVASVRVKNYSLGKLIKAHAGRVRHFLNLLLSAVILDIQMFFRVYI